MGAESPPPTTLRTKGWGPGVLFPRPGAFQIAAPDWRGRTHDPTSDRRAGSGCGHSNPVVARQKASNISPATNSAHTQESKTYPDFALQPTPVNTSPGSEYASSTRVYQAIPSIERAEKGRLAPKVWTASCTSSMIVGAQQSERSFWPPSPRKTLSNELA